MFRFRTLRVSAAAALLLLCLAAIAMNIATAKRTKHNTNNNKNENIIDGVHAPSLLNPEYWPYEYPQDSFMNSYDSGAAAAAQFPSQNTPPPWFDPSLMQGYTTQPLTPADRAAASEAIAAAAAARGDDDDDDVFDNTNMFNGFAPPPPPPPPPSPWMGGHDHNEINSDELINFLREAGVDDETINKHIRSARGGSGAAGNARAPPGGRSASDEHVMRSFETMTDEEILHNLDNPSIIASAMAAFGATTQPPPTEQEQHTAAAQAAAAGSEAAAAGHTRGGGTDVDIASLFEDTDQDTAAAAAAANLHRVVDENVKLIDIPFDNCNTAATTNPIVTVTKMQASSWPPTPDTDMTLHAECQVNEDINDGTYTVKVLLNTVQLFSKTASLNEFMTLPIKKGVNNLTKAVHTPSFMPAGEYEVDVQLNSADQQTQLACIKIKAKIDTRA